MSRKYLRGLQYTSGTNGRDIAIFMRICYEFWGYCVNGTSSLTVPGGMPTTPTSAPTNFFEGTTVLASGSDGVTSAIGTTFTSSSATFTSAMIGKHITVWYPASTSTDDSIYRITGIASATQLIITPFSGGTPDISTLKNNLTSRSALNYRVFDAVAGAALVIASGNYFVGTLSGASTINSGQASSQFQFLLRGVSTTFGQLGIVGSPAGTWTGSAFTGTNMTERITATAVTFTGGVSGVAGYITLIADKDFFIGHVRSTNSSTTAGFYFYVTIPQRIYTLAQDPNPLTVLVGANNLATAVGSDSHTSAFGMVDFGGTTRSHQLITRNFIGDGLTSGPIYTLGPNFQAQLTYQLRAGKVMYNEALMSYSGTVGQFSLARCKLRPIAFTSVAVPLYHLVGESGQFIHVGNGVLWPWDGAILPYNLLPLGT